MGVRPAPILISNGWTDDLFPVDEALRYANKVFDKYPRAPLAQLHFDYGHPRGQNKSADAARLSTRMRQWFDHYVKGQGGVKVLRGVEALTQTCPTTRPSRGPYRATTWDGLSRGEVRYSRRGAHTVLSSSGRKRCPRRLIRPAAVAHAPPHPRPTRRAPPPTGCRRQAATDTRCSARPP